MRWRAAIGQLTLSTPSRCTPRRMNGITVVLSLKSAASPTDATVPPIFDDARSHARMSPPRLSTAPANVARSSGRIFAKSIDWRSTTSFAPIPFRYSDSSALPVMATT